mmetsp:Transcript_7809/g.11746  ORF Transcript_7809/g.11746 Transcript_7809/m.11746 type:complete len:469 (+) Transcript_7809:115-1521(+)
MTQRNNVNRRGVIFITVVGLIGVANMIIMTALFTPQNPFSAPDATASNVIILDEANEQEVIKNTGAINDNKKATTILPDDANADTSAVTNDSTLKDDNIGDHSETGSTTRHNANTTSSHNTTSFKRYDGVVIVTKVLKPDDEKKLRRFLCMLAHAYNDKVQYDMVVFTTLPWGESEIANLQKIWAPAKLTVVIEAPPLEDQLAAMPDEERDFLRKRCGLKFPNETLTYNNWCTEPNYKGGYISLGYSWQAEFRAYHIWTHDAIKKYKYMMWLDSDAMVTKVWDKDPMQVMVENDLIIMYSSFGYGVLRNTIVKDKMIKWYNKSLCSINERQCHGGAGLCEIFCGDDPSEVFNIKQIGGYHHITNLDVYRKPIHQQFLKDFVGIHRFSREMDDQIGVTIPAMMEQSMRNDGKMRVVNENKAYNLDLMIAHHGHYDDRQNKKVAPRNPNALYNKFAESDPTLKDRCQSFL